MRNPVSKMSGLWPSDGPGGAAESLLRPIAVALIIGAGATLALVLLGLPDGRERLIPALCMLIGGGAGLLAARARQPQTGRAVLVAFLAIGYLSFAALALLEGVSGAAAISATAWFGILCLSAGLLLGRGLATAATIGGLAVALVAILFGDWAGPLASVEGVIAAIEIGVLGYLINLALRAGTEARARAAATQRELEQTRATLEEQVADRAQTLALAAAVGRQISRIQDLDTLLSEAVELIRERFDLYHVQVYLLSSATAELVLRAATGDAGKDLRQRRHRLSVGPGSINGTAAAGREPVVVPRARQNTMFLPNQLLPDTQSEMAIPLIAEDEVIGTLDLQSADPTGLGPENVIPFTVLAAQLATAVENARLFSEIAETRERLAQQAATLTRDGWQRFLTDRPDGLGLGAPPADDGDRLRQAIDVRGATIGTIELGGATAETETARELTAAVAGQLGAHLENLRLTRQAEAALDEARRREAELTLLNRVVTELSASADIESSLQLIVDQLAVATGIQQVGVAILNEDKQGLTVVADRSGSLNTDSARGFVIPIENNPATQMALRERRPVVVPHATENPLTASAHQVLRQRGVKTILILPLIVENEVIGTIGLDVVEEGLELTDDQLRLAETIVYQAASTIQRARLFNEVRARSRQLESLSRIEADLSLATTEEEILLSLAGGPPWSEPPALELVYLTTRAGDGALLAEAVSRVEGQIVGRPQGGPQPLSALPLSALWLEQPRELLVLEDAAADPRLDEATRAQLRREGRPAQVVLPLRRGGQWQGLLTLSWPTPHRLTADELFVLQRLHEPLAATIAGRRAYLAQRAALAATEALYNVSARLNMAQSYDDILAVINQHTELGRAADALHFVHFDQPWLPDRPPEWVSILAQWRRDGAEAAPRRYRLEEYPLVRRLRADRPTVFADFVNDPRLDRAAREANEPTGVRSAVLAPLVVGGQWIGYIGLFYLRAERTFAEAEIDGLAGLIGQVSVAAQTILLLEQTREVLASEQRQRRIANTLLNSARVMSESLDESVLRDELLGQLYETAPAAAFINLYEWLPDDNRFRLERRTGEATGDDRQPASAGRIGSRFSPDERPDLWQALSGGRALTQAAEPSGEFYRLPWRVGRRTTGVVEIYRAAPPEAERPAPLTIGDQRRCEGIVQQAALAFQNAQSYGQTQTALADQARLSGQLRAVSDVSVTAAATLDVNRLLASAADLTKENFGLYHTHIYLLDEDRTTLVLRGGAGSIGRQMVREGRQISMGATSIVARAAREREVVLVDDTRQSTDFLPHPLLPNTRSEVAVPLIIGDRLLGVLDVQSDQVGHFQPEDRQVYKILAAQLAVATQNATYFGEQLQMAEKLREVDRLKTDFLARMSHELRTPLNSIIGFADVLLMGLDGELTERMVEDMQLIRSSGYHLRDIIGDILDMSKIEAGRLELIYETFDLRRVASELMATATPLAEQKGVLLQLDVAEGVTLLTADRTRVRQVLWNLLGNAIKFTDHGTIRVTARLDGDALLFSVTDTGIGIAAEHLPHIFDHFSQIEGGRRESISGTGLGLSISKSLVELHGGQIWATSEPGRGSTFCFTIPLVNEVLGSRD